MPRRPATGFTLWWTGGAGASYRNSLGKVPVDPVTARLQRARIIMGLFNFLRFPSHDMAIDLGTANTVVYVRGRGVVLNEPSVVAIATLNGGKRVQARADDARLLMGKT